ncbi:ion channel protein (macronuclear) [Tetrahymena thermophila SB210]|uniref:Ion channel protein n=1 Tax=Tetrahymena thermophila (strain SB210) TaxID=312017 RepID=Q22KK5_TETTS|nr:ion channel protein [Tetrahymena thermophila SB210]EAR85794.2 ion channel protein [Tetrahymena thermophila SB210]|eukprot:XP_001033457.2 ion channel protein [Tetrahymena thermophila SB210]
MKQSDLEFQEDSPQLKQKQEQTENDASTLQTIIAGNSSSPDKVLRQKISQLSEGKSRPKFNRISFQKCENFDEDVVDPKKIVKSSNKGLRLRQIINGLFQTSIIIFNCFYTKNGEYIYATFGFVLGCLSQWLLMDIHLDKFTIQQIKKLQKQRVTQSNSPRKKENKKINSIKVINRKASKNSSLNQSKLSNNIKALTDNQKKTDLIEICQIQQMKRDSYLNIKQVEDIQNNKDNSLNKNQSHSLNKQCNSIIQQNTSFQHNRRATSIMGISDNQKLKQSRGSSQQQSPKNMHDNSNIISNLMQLNAKQKEQTILYEKRRSKILQRKSTALTNNDFINQKQQKPIQINSQSNQDITFNAIEKDQENNNRSIKTQKQMKSRRQSIKIQTKTSIKSKKQGKSQKKNYQNDEMAVLKKANWCQMFHQLNYQWIQYLINLLPLITMAVRDQDTLRNLLLLQFLRGIFIIDAFISYQQVELTHQYTEYVRRYLNLNPFKFVTVYLILLIILSSYIYYVIEDFTTLWDSIWNIIVSITTIGYGDIVPQTNAGRALIIIVTNISVVFLSFITSFIQNTQEFTKEQQQSFDKIIRDLKEKKIKMQSIFVIKYFFHYHLPPCQEIIHKIKSNKSFVKLDLKQNYQLEYQYAYIPSLPIPNINIEESKEQQNMINSGQKAENAINQLQEFKNIEKSNEQKKDVYSCVVQIEGNVNSGANQTNNKQLIEIQILQQQQKEKKKYYMSKIRKYLEEKKKQDHSFLNKVKQKYMEIDRLIRAKDNNFYLMENKILPQTKTNTNQFTQRGSILGENSPMNIQKIIRVQNILGNQNYHFSTFEDQNKLVSQIKTFQDQNKLILKTIEEIKNQQYQQEVKQNEDSSDSYELSSNNTNCKHANKIISQSNSVIPETPKQMQINIPSNYKTMTFQAGTYRSINTCETPVNNTRRIPQPFNSKLCIEDDSSNNLSRLQTCKGDADPNTIESSQQINTLIIFNQSSENIQSSKNFKSQNQVCKFSSCSDLDGTSIVTTKIKYNKNCIKDLDQQQVTNNTVNDQKNTFKKNKNKKQENEKEDEDEDDFSENQSEFSQANKQMVNQLVKVNKNGQNKKNSIYQEQSLKDNCKQEPDIFHVQNLDNSDICSNSQITQNQISAPPSSLPLAKFLKKNLQQNKLSCEEFDNQFEQEDEEQQSNKTEAHSQNQKVDSSKGKMHQNSIIPGFTDKYLKSNPKFLQDVNYSNDCKVPKITKIRQFSLDLPVFQQGEKFILFNNNQQSLAEESNLKQEEEI